MFHKVEPSCTKWTCRRKMSPQKILIILSCKLFINIPPYKVIGRRQKTSYLASVNSWKINVRRLSEVGKAKLESMNVPRALPLAHQPQMKINKLKIYILTLMGPCILIIFQYMSSNATLDSLFYLETALHVSGGTSTHHQERKQLYLQHLVFVTLLLLPAAITAGSSNSLTNNRCCRYSCLRSWWWVEVPPETRRAVSR